MELDHSPKGVRARAVDYLVTCSLTQGGAYPNARKAVEQTLREDERLNAEQLAGIYVTAEEFGRAVWHVNKQWSETLTEGNGT